MSDVKQPPINLCSGPSLPGIPTYPGHFKEDRNFEMRRKLLTFHELYGHRNY